MAKLWSHCFIEDECLICGAYFQDACHVPIGCEAGPEGNHSAYMGSAMTPFEYGLGYTSLDKVQYLTEGGPTGPRSMDAHAQALANWNAKILRELEERGLEIK